MPWWKFRALQFSRYLLERTGSPDRDKNARPSIVKLSKNYSFRAFLAPFKRRELRCPGENSEPRSSPVIYSKKPAFLIGIKMRGQMPLNLVKTTRSAHFWPHCIGKRPFHRQENCEVQFGTSQLVRSAILTLANIEQPYHTDVVG